MVNQPLDGHAYEQLIGWHVDEIYSVVPIIDLKFRLEPKHEQNEYGRRIAKGMEVFGCWDGAGNHPGDICDFLFDSGRLPLI